MAKENDEVQHNNNNSCSNSGRNNNGMDSLPASVGVTTSNVTEATAARTDFVAEMAVGNVTAADGKGKANSADGGDCAIGSSRSNQFVTSTTSFMRGKLNDLVADLCINGPMGSNDNNSGYGDYTNERSNSSGTTAHVEAGTQQTNLGSTWEPVSSSSNTQPVTQPHAPPTQNTSSFSFKHFLSSGPPLTAPSSTVTVTTLDAPTSNNVNGTQSNNANGSSNNGATIQTSTGARPKVPQSASLSSTSISSLMTGSNVASSSTTGGGQPEGGNSFSASATKMKRSPRFSSFDSQACLAEYVTVGADPEIEGMVSTGTSGVRTAGVGANANSGFRLYPESSDFFSSSTRVSRGMGDGGTGVGGGINSTGEYDRHQYVPRSYSNYEMPMSSSSSSPRRRPGVANINSGGGGTREARPTRLALNTNSSKSKVNLPLGDLSSGACGGPSTAAAPPVTRPLPSNAGEFPNAVLPDFVQDHWLESWYAHDMHLDSPPNSPIRDFSDVDVAGGAVGGGGGGGVNDVSGGIGIPGPSPVYGSGGACGGGGGATAEATASNAKMLPDFLSDGPIIHSSQRLADVAVGLPSNSIGSPDDPPISSQLSRLRIENERLQRELNDSRIALNEQARRANDLERQLHARELQQQHLQQQQQQQKRVGEVTTTERVEGLAEKSKRTRATTSTPGVTALKQQVTQLTLELEALRRENETLREEGAVGGFNVPCCDRSRPFATDASGGAAVGAEAGVRGAVGRPSRTQQISRDLLRAATNAENNLRQLLAGVDNLRQMAADIENSELRLGYDVSPDLFSDFLDDCDDYENYSDGPTL
ncbi:mucin-5AC [Anastrepha ludens]|uniref:mucin-5AC n=1 Tax=Anastrepha ludens TaxID=28586 RepID=UPI0023B13F34|nr:mucin-5AC [Anastrepha ludens]